MFGKLRKLGVPSGIRQCAKHALFWVYGIRSQEAGSGELRRYGDGDAPWELRSDLITPGALILVAGLSDDIAFEEDFLSIHNEALFFGLDPTPLCAPILEDLESSFPGRVEYEPAALGGEDGRHKVWAELDAEGTPVYYYWTRPLGADQKVLEERSLPIVGIESLLERFAEREVDLLKLDIEGAEYAVMEHFLKQAFRPKQLLIEFHYRFEGCSLSGTKEVISKLRGIGYHLEWMSKWREEFLFVYHGED